MALRTEEVQIATAAMSLVERAVWLVDHKLFRIPDVSVVLDLSPNIIRSAVGAVHEGRVIGHVGRPRTLHVESEEALCDRISLEDDNGNTLTKSQCLDLVRNASARVFSTSPTFQATAPVETFRIVLTSLNQSLLSNQANEIYQGQIEQDKKAGRINPEKEISWKNKSPRLSASFMGGFLHRHPELHTKSSHSVYAKHSRLSAAGQTSSSSPSM